MCVWEWVGESDWNLPYNWQRKSEDYYPESPGGTFRSRRFQVRTKSLKYHVDYDVRVLQISQVSASCAMRVRCYSLSQHWYMCMYVYIYCILQVPPKYLYECLTHDDIIDQRHHLGGKSSTNPAVWAEKVTSTPNTSINGYITQLCKQHLPKFTQHLCKWFQVQTNAVQHAQLKRLKA